MMAFVGTFVCVHKEESWTHRIKHLKSECSEQGTVGERSRSDGRSWKRRCCQEPRCREWRDGMMVNANQVFYWRKLYREGQLGSRTATQLVAVALGTIAATDSSGNSANKSVGQLLILL